jgi:hypothetical protein
MVLPLAAAHYFTLPIAGKMACHGFGGGGGFTPFKFTGGQSFPSSIHFNRLRYSQGDTQPTKE